MAGQAISERVMELTGARTPFVHATVVRAQPPTSVQPGDGAIVLPDGTMEGFVGGQCTRNSVRTAALAALADGAATLLRVLPDGTAEFPATPGAQVVVNPCLSGGAVEIFLRPVLPAPVVAVTGSTPIAEALRATVSFLGYAAPTVQGSPGSPVTVPPSGAASARGSEPAPGTQPAPDTQSATTGEATSGATLPGRNAFSAEDLAGCAAVVLASHGPGEAETIRAALDAGVGYIAMVASRRRGAGVLDEMGLSDTERARVHTPAGLWIGARTAPEIALSIMAEVVATIRGVEQEAGAGEGHDTVSTAGTTATSASGAGSPTSLVAATSSSDAPGDPSTTMPAHSVPATPTLAPMQAIDPVCGMTVTIMPDTPHLRIDGEDFYFCRPGCRDTFAAQRAG
jgi:xanthine dehydrogenase accessory factor